MTFPLDAQQAVPVHSEMLTEATAIEAVGSTIRLFSHWSILSYPPLDMQSTERIHPIPPIENSTFVYLIPEGLQQQNGSRKSD